MSFSSSIPKVPRQWQTHAIELLVLDVSMSQLTKLDSASKMTEQQFLCRRVLWPGSKKANKSPKSPKTIKARIDEVMVDFPEFDACLHQLRTRERSNADRKMGAFRTEPCCMDGQVETISQ
ncbi:hypothetical protein N7537_009040 [Penicillium hordei]|uniref:Uncharacterized protein n=1 Tax=Penicillium hordei TaxID=40994 RepID=A0AAD6DS48_9EURO|nr:uncharacterized protein N7537_009040 [Penicillium hordei]KAJ5592136.1 hypothetical protein N7537_009040 [Penicillium hordei]